MAKGDYKDTVADDILKLLKNNMGANEIKTYMLGDPFAIPQTSLPAIIVEFEASEIEVETTAQDRVADNLIVKIVFNKKDDFNKVSDEVTGHRKLRELAQGVDSTTGEFSQYSVAGILRKNFTLSSTIADQAIRIEYGVMPRPENVLTEEAHVRISVDTLTTVTNRV